MASLMLSRICLIKATRGRGPVLVSFYGDDELSSQLLATEASSTEMHAMYIQYRITLNQRKCIQCTCFGIQSFIYKSTPDMISLQQSISSTWILYIQDLTGRSLSRLLAKLRLACTNNGVAGQVASQVLPG